MEHGRIAQRKLSGHPEQEQRPTKPMVGGSIPSTPATLSNNCPSVVEATEGLILGPKPRTGLTPTVILAPRPQKARAKMTCHNCRIQMVKAGFYGQRKSSVGSASSATSDSANHHSGHLIQDVRLPVEKVTMILRCLAEGNRVRSTSRLCDVEKRTVLNLLKTAGDCCERFMERTLRDVPVRDLQLDECWSYVLKKEGHKLPHEENDDTIGDQYIYIGLERNSKLVVAWHLGRRNRENTSAFIAKIRSHR